jgi:hypothetical protein
MPGPVKNVAFTTNVVLRDAAAPQNFRANPTLAAGDVTVSGDEGAFGNIATLPTVTPAAGVNVRVSLAQAEMNFDRILLRFKDQTATAEWLELYLVIHTSAT